MHPDAAQQQHDYMQGRDYLHALLAGKYFILIFVCLAMALTGLYSYAYLAKYEASVVLRSGTYVGEHGEITPVLQPQSLVHLVTEGFFNGLVRSSRKLDSGKPLAFDAVNPDDTDLIKLTYQTDDAAQGLSVLRELLAQLSKYYDQERRVKVQSASARYLRTLSSDLSALEINRETKVVKKKAFMTIRERLQKMLTTARQEKRKGSSEELAAQINATEKRIQDNDKDIATVERAIMDLRKQNDRFTAIVKRGTALVVIQEPMIVASNFAEALFRNIFVAGVLALVFAVLLQFIVYDFKMGKKQPS